MSSNRRDFLTASAAALGVAGFPLVIPATAIGRDGKAAPSERIVMGCIGTGGKGRNNMGTFMSFPDVQVVAVADCDSKHAETAKNDVNKKYSNTDCVAYKDYRELVARTDLDAVSIASPDHWHGLQSVAAANAGKDIYCEKPLTNSIAEGRAVCEAVRRNNRVLQTGSHERSGNNARHACELVLNGRIGKLQALYVNLPTVEPQHKKVLDTKTVAPEMPIPAELDYDSWLGYTPWAPYTESRVHFWWRFNMAYGGGEMTDRGAHVIDIGQLGAGKDATGPVEIEAKGEHCTGSIYDAFFNFSFTNTYADGLMLFGTSDPNKPRGVKFQGSNGSIFVHIHGQKLEADPESVLTSVIGDNEIKLGRSPGHHRNFIDSVKSRVQPVASAEIGHRTASICHLNNIAMKLNRKLKWDPVKEEFPGDAEANALIGPTMRSPWKWL